MKISDYIVIAVLVLWAVIAVIYIRLLALCFLKVSMGFAVLFAFCFN